MRMAETCPDNTTYRYGVKHKVKLFPKYFRLTSRRPICIIGNMKKRYVRRRLQRLISVHGSREAVAVLLRRTERYVRMLEKGEANPGDLLYDLIKEKYDRTF